jgi:uncharacterized protein
MLLDKDSTPTLAHLVEVFDSYLPNRYPSFFGKDATHPTHRVKEHKVIHDNLWGTNRFSWIEMAIIDCPLFQRIRYIHQTGLAFLVYPTAHHTRFEHSLGVVTIASRIFDALFQRYPQWFKRIEKEVYKNERDLATVFEVLRAELRLACLLHDIGHSIHSHASEFIYGNLPLLEQATLELGQFAGEKKGAGEVISFCISQTEALRELIGRTRKKVVEPQLDGASLNFDNISLLIIGRSFHPLLQFMGNIVSGPCDADKLDYLARDSSFAGLPLKYDLERFLYTIGLSLGPVADTDKKLTTIYRKAGVKVVVHETGEHPTIDNLQLRPPRQLISTIEQITICKFMLFTYIYHHKKVRSAEGTLIKLLDRRVSQWRADKLKDEDILLKFMDLKDADLESPDFRDNSDEIIREYTSRIVDRLLPRMVFEFVSNNRSKAEAKLKTFGRKLAEPKLGKVDPKRQAIDKFEESLRAELEKQIPDLRGKDILLRTGVWLDVPKAPSFESTENLSIGDESPMPLKMVFPIKPWVDGYEANRYYIRVFAFSEYVVQAKKAVETALMAVVGLNEEELASTEDFFAQNKA